MHVEVGDRLVLHGQHGTRIGVVVEGEEAGSRIRWADGGESVLSTHSEPPEEVGHATWQSAKAGPSLGWRRGVTAGVGREASLRQEKLAKEMAKEPVVEQPPAPEPEAAEAAAKPAEAPEVAEEQVEHRPAAGE